MEKKFIFTKHSKQRMLERGISLVEVKEVIEFPEYVISKGMNIEAYKNNLKIVYISKDKFIKIITVIKK